MHAIRERRLRGFTLERLVPVVGVNIQQWGILYGSWKKIRVF